MKNNKFIYLFVLQGDYGYGWDDLTSSELLTEVRQDKKDYMNNCRRPYRIIKRVEKNLRYIKA